LLKAAAKSLAKEEKERALASKETAKNLKKEAEILKDSQRTTKQNLGLRRKQTQSIQKFGKTVADGSKKIGIFRRFLNFTNAELKKSGENANRISFTFRRLFGILAAFAAARVAIQGFKDLVRSSLDFNRRLEQANLGVASLLLAVGDLRGEMGETVDISERFILAQAEARKQVQLLRKDALTTTATFEELLETFQVGLAPGVQAGLDVNEIRRFTLRISQAAAAIGLSQNQLAEEIRSILAGTIQARTTRIAVSLGITNADIRRMKEAGRLGEFLTEKFSAFEEASAKTAKSFSGLVARVRDAFRGVLGAAGKGLFDELKGELETVFGAFTEVKGDFITPNEKAVKSFKFIFDGLRVGLAQAKEMIATLSGGSTFETIAEFFGEALGTGLTIVLGILQGIVEAGNNIIGIFKNIFQLLTGITGKLPASELRDIVASAVEILFTFKALNLVFGNINSKVGLLKVGFTGAFFVAAQLSKIILQNTAETSEITLAQTTQLQTTLLKQRAELAILAAKVAATYVTPGAAPLRKKALKDISDAIERQKEEYGKQLALIETARDREQRRKFEAKEQDKRLKELNEELNKSPVLISSATDAFKETEKVITDAQKKLKAFQVTSGLETSLAGVGGEELQILIKARGEIHQSLQQTQKDIIGTRQTISNLIKRGSEYQEKVINLSAKERAELNQVLAIHQERIKAQKETKAVEDEILLLTKEISAAEDKGDKAEADRLRNKVASAKTAKEQLQTELQAIAVGLRFVDPKTANLAQQLLPIVGQLKGEREKLLAIQNAEKDVSKAILDLAKARAQVARDRRIEENRIATQELAIQVTNQQRLNKAYSEGASVSQLDLVTAKNRADEIRHEISLINERFDREIRAQEIALAHATSLEESEQILEGINALEAQRAAELGLQTELLKEQEAQAKRLEARISRGLIGGFEQAAEYFVTDFQSSFEAGVAIMQSSMEGFADFLSTAITDSLDPNGKGIRENFANFLRGIGNMIIQQLTRVALAKATIGLFPGLLGFNDGGFAGASGFNRGGFAHFGPHARGFASGGISKPSWIHPKDTIPAWLAPGEGIIPVNRVMQYGKTAISRIIDGSIDPMGLNALANVSSRSSRIASPTQPSFNQGGFTSSAMSANQAEQRTGQQTSSSRTFVQPAIVANEDTMDTLLFGGKGALLRRFKDWGPEIKSALGVT